MLCRGYLSLVRGCLMVDRGGMPVVRCCTTVVSRGLLVRGVGEDCGFAVVRTVVLDYSRSLAVVSCGLPFKRGASPGDLLSLRSRLLDLNMRLVVVSCGLACVSCGALIISCDSLVAGLHLLAVVVARAISCDVGGSDEGNGRKRDAERDATTFPGVRCCARAVDGSDHFQLLFFLIGALGRRARQAHGSHDGLRRACSFLHMATRSHTQLHVYPRTCPGGGHRRIPRARMSTALPVVLARGTSGTAAALRHQNSSQRRSITPPAGVRVDYAARGRTAGKEAHLSWSWLAHPILRTRERARGTDR